MRIRSIKITNYKCFESLEHSFKNFGVFVGENNTGKSALFLALDTFLSSTGKKANISIDDFHINKDDEKANELSIEITFDSLNEQAVHDFKEYTHTPKVTLKLTARREGEIINSKFTGIRRGLKEFTQAFELSKISPISDFNEEYAKLQKSFDGLPPKTQVSNKDAKLDALRTYEAKVPDDCVDIESNDEAYGAIGPNPIIRKYLKWVFIPAVKNAAEESLEGRNTLSELIAFAARKQTNFDEKIAQLEKTISSELSEIQNHQRSALDDVAKSLNLNFQQISMGNETIELDWEHNSGDLKIVHPKAAVKLVSGSHRGAIELFGHGLQRNYLVALFKIISEIQEEESDFTPSLLIAFEEPELYQHPPQAKLLARYLFELSNHEQVLITTHSPLFITPDFFDKLSTVRNSKGKTILKNVSLEDFTESIGKIFNTNTDAVASTIASFHTLFNLEIVEIFFSRFVVLVEGLEDLGYLNAAIEAYGKRAKFLELGINIVPALGKNQITPIIEICKHFGIPFFVIIDCDNKYQGAKKSVNKGIIETNLRLFSQLGIECESGFIEKTLMQENFCVWPDNISKSVLDEHPNFEKNLSIAKSTYGCRDFKNPKLVYSAILRQIEEHGEIKCLRAVLENIYNVAEKEVK
ncbi:ATP-dependent nuclease [Litorimonas sp.]|uniref:ATP-dependent nuclease n=1 Tax=Litorimonas sp. TaxID=1892381 RepID=UPI003A89D155